MTIIRLRDQHIRRTPPVDIADAVQLWAREQGRRFGRLEWNAMLDCWVIHLGRKLTDPMMREYQEGRLAEEPTESVMLNEWDPKRKRYVALRLEEYGASGIRNLLDEANTWSGRGRHNSIQEGIAAVRAHNQKIRERQRKTVREAGQETGWLHRRRLLGIPYVQTGIDLRTQG
jgi:hypothetical protein